MKRFLSIFAVSLIAASIGLADEIHLKNQDVIRGTIIKKEGGTLTVKTELFGVL